MDAQFEYKLLHDLDVTSVLSLDPDVPSASIQDSMASLMNMADKMESLLPPELNVQLSPPLPDTLSTITKTEPLQNIQLDITDISAPIPFQQPQDNTSPCAIRDFSYDLPRISKPRKQARKPKTYSKPVASRFCHICSRMPRRGQGSATCRRMQEGFCRKIVCEQCLREQGWDYERIRSNPDSWLCPHCSEICPPRSQCHIYNRINARRKRAPPKQASVAAALASSDVLLGPYAHLFNSGHAPASNQILQPPPNFRLNLPPQYSQQ